MTTDHTFYQHGDIRDAANFAAAFGMSVRTSYILAGLEFTVDLDTLELEVDEGAAAVWRGEFETEDPRIDPVETRMNTAHPVEIETREGIALEDDDVNHVFLDANIETSDTPTIDVNTTGNPPTDESFKIGEIDTSESTEVDAISDQWRLVADDGTLTFPDPDALDEVAAELRPGTILFDRETSEHYEVN